MGWYLIPVKPFDTGASTALILCPANTGSQHICLKLPAPKLALCANRMHPGAVSLRQTLPCLRAWIQTSASLAGHLYSHSLPGVAECSICHQLSSTGRALMALPALGFAVGRVAERYRCTCSRVGGPSSPLPCNRSFEKEQGCAGAILLEFYGLSPLSHGSSSGFLWRRGK